MKKSPILRYHNVLAVIKYTKAKCSTRSSYLIVESVFVAFVLLLAACGGAVSNNTVASAISAPIRVNGFGTAANHPHAFLVFPNHVLVMATHYGTFWSGNDGASW